jgi:hypothetical protein
MMHSIASFGGDEAAAPAMVFADASHLCFDRPLDLNHKIGLAPYLISYRKNLGGIISGRFGQEFKSDYSRVVSRFNVTLSPTGIELMAIPLR